ERTPERLAVSVADRGAGLPPDFDLDNMTSLGLQIVRTLVVTELGGHLDIGPNDGGGTLVRVELPLASLPDARPAPAMRPAAPALRRAREPGCACPGA